MESSVSTLLGGNILETFLLPDPAKNDCFPTSLTKTPADSPAPLWSLQTRYDHLKSLRKLRLAF